MNLTRHIYTSRSEKVIHFLIGFVGWIVVNGVLWTLIVLGIRWGTFSGVPYTGQIGGAAGFYATIGFFPWAFLVNLGILIYLGFTRYWIGLGALTAFAANLLITVVLGLFWIGVCSVPFPVYLQ